MESSTQVLRRMLDERGVKWDYGITCADTTRFSANGIDLTFTPMRGGVVCSTVLTPEQAIAATLGRGTCHAIISDNLNESEELKPCPWCGAKAEVWQDNVRTWGLIEHKPDCWLAYDVPRHKQEIPRAEFAAWNRRAGEDA